MESSPRQVYTRQVSKPYEGTVEKVIICEEGLASQGTIKYENEDVMGFLRHRQCPNLNQR